MEAFRGLTKQRTEKKQPRVIKMLADGQLEHYAARGVAASPIIIFWGWGSLGIKISVNRKPHIPRRSRPT
jgi:hypothetical protein